VVAALCVLTAAGALAATRKPATSASQGARAPAGARTVQAVQIAGNARVEEDAIRVHLETQPGMSFDQDTVDRDIRSVYAMGFFDQVTAETTPGTRPTDVVVTFRVQERPLVRNVSIDGNDKLGKEELEGALKIRPHVILDPAKAREGIDAARKLYADKGYLDAKITYTTAPKANRSGCRTSSSRATRRSPIVR
jgi:outer membrane protein insertion porin family